MDNYRLLITHYGLFYRMSDYETYEEAKKALPYDLPTEGWSDRYGMEIVRKKDWKVVDRGWFDSHWGWVIGGVEGLEIRFKHKDV